MSTSVQKKAIKDFKAVTSATDKVATECLTQHSWNVEQACDFYFSNRHKYPSTGSSSSGKIDTQKLTSLAQKYTGTGDEKDIICGEKLAEFFKDINIDPSGMLTLALAWQLKCKNFGEISKNEFIEGFSALGEDSLDKMKGETSRINALLADKKNYREFYRWLFDFIKDEGERKTIDSEAAIEMWALVLPPIFPLDKEWLTFCTSQGNKLKVVSKDLWDQLFEFAKEVKPDMSNYDADGAWPVILDEFVDFVKGKGKGKK